MSTKLNLDRFQGITGALYHGLDLQSRRVLDANAGLLIDLIERFVDASIATNGVGGPVIGRCKLCEDKVSYLAQRGSDETGCPCVLSQNLVADLRIRVAALEIARAAQANALEPVPAANTEGD